MPPPNHSSNKTETKVKVFVSSGHENKKKVKIRLVDTSTNKYLSVDGFSRSNNTNMFIANIPKMEKTFMLKLRVVHFDMIGNASKDLLTYHHAYIHLNLDQIDKCFLYWIYIYIYIKWKRIYSKTRYIYIYIPQHGRNK
jgi:hypothetical protein